VHQDQADVAEQLCALPKTSIGELRALWEKLFGGSPRFPVRRQLLVHMLAYRLQERAYGGLSKSSRRRLESLAETHGNSADRTFRVSAQPKPGTRLIREWRGETHVVSMLDQGAEYRGERYRSLSEIARKITGTRWSGPAFFGLKSLQRIEIGKSR